MNAKELPWLRDHWQQLVHLANSDRLPHALLVVAPEGLGVTMLASEYMHFLICQNPENDKPCGECSSCHLFQAGTHPDFHHLSVEEKSRDIKIEQIRSLIEKLAERPHQNGRRLVLVEPADAMNKSASNAFLKTLEEPGEDTFLLLLTSRLEALPATIRSRCQVRYIKAPEETLAIDHVLEHYPDQPAIVQTAVRLAQNQPLTALELLQSGALEERQDFFAYLSSMLRREMDPMTFAVKHKTTADVIKVSDWLYDLLSDAEKMSVGIGPDMLLNHDQKPLLEQLISRPVDNRYQWQQKLLENKRLMVNATNINPQLTMETLMTGWIAFLAD